MLDMLDINLLLHLRLGGSGPGLRSWGSGWAACSLWPPATTTSTPAWRRPRPGPARPAPTASAASSTNTSCTPATADTPGDQCWSSAT